MDDVKERRCVRFARTISHSPSHSPFPVFVIELFEPSLALSRWLFRSVGARPAVLALLHPVRPARESPDIQ